MSSEKQIFPNKRDMKKLSSRALGLLTTMLNIPENDYLTATELYAIRKLISLPILLLQSRSFSTRDISLWYMTDML